MSIFAKYLITEAGLIPSDKKTVDQLTKQIQAIDKIIETKVGPAGKGPFMQQTGDTAGHMNDQDPQYKALTARRAMLLARRLKLTNKAELAKP